MIRNLTNDQFYWPSELRLPANSLARFVVSAARLRIFNVVGVSVVSPTEKATYFPSLDWRGGSWPDE